METGLFLYSSGSLVPYLVITAACVTGLLVIALLLVYSAKEKKPDMFFGSLLCLLLFLLLYFMWDDNQRRLQHFRDQRSLRYTRKPSYFDTHCYAPREMGPLDALEFVLLDDNVTLLSVNGQRDHSERISYGTKMFMCRQRLFGVFDFCQLIPLISGPEDKSEGLACPLVESPRNRSFWEDLDCSGTFFERNAKVFCSDLF